MTNEKFIILFDDSCNLCSGAIDFIRKRDKTGSIYFVPLRSDKSHNFIKKFQIPSETDSILLINGDHYVQESDAIIEILSHLPAPWNCLQVFKILPKNLRDKIYRWIAKNRYHWFGKRELGCNLNKDSEEPILN